MKFSLFYLICFLSYLTMFSQGTLQGVDPTTLEDTLTNYVNQFKAKERAIGLQISVKTPGKLDWHYASGLAVLNPPQQALPGMVFRVASVSKLFCATAVLQLEQRGMLKLGDPISKWLPQKLVTQLRNGDSISICDLLLHTSGIYEPSFLNYINDSIDFRPILMDKIAEMNQFTPYGFHFYSNANYFLLSEIIQVASGMSYESYIQNNIIEPLQLKDTYLMHLPLANRFHGYIQSIFLDRYKDIQPSFLIDASDFNISFTKGAADISSSTRDLVKFYEGLHNGKILSLNYVEQMIEKSVLRNDIYQRYGLGTMLFTHADHTFFYGHLGTLAGYKTLLLYYPKTNTYIALALNLHEFPSSKVLDLVVKIFKIIETFDTN